MMIMSEDGGETAQEQETLEMALKAATDLQSKADNINAEIKKFQSIISSTQELH